MVMVYDRFLTSVVIHSRVEEAVFFVLIKVVLKLVFENILFPQNWNLFILLWN